MNRYTSLTTTAPFNQKEAITNLTPDFIKLLEKYNVITKRGNFRTTTSSKYMFRRFNDKYYLFKDAYQNNDKMDYHLLYSIIDELDNFTETVEAFLVGGGTCFLRNTDVSSALYKYMSVKEILMTDKGYPVRIDSSFIPLPVRNDSSTVLSQDKPAIFQDKLQVFKNDNGYNISFIISLSIMVIFVLVSILGIIACIRFKRRSVQGPIVPLDGIQIVR